LFKGPNEDERVISVIEVYYDKKNKPESYCESNVLDCLESKKAIKWTLKKVKKAYKKDIIDLDNWPNEWKND
jgi:hypothetical protein